MQPVSATLEPNTLTAHETELAEAITAGMAGRRDRGTLVLAITQKGNGETWLSEQSGSVCSGGGMPGQGYQAVLVSESLPMSARVNVSDTAATLTSSTSPGRGGSEGPMQLVPPIAQYWETRVARNGRGAPDELAHALKGRGRHDRIRRCSANGADHAGATLSVRPQSVGGRSRRSTKVCGDRVVPRR